MTPLKKSNSQQWKQKYDQLLSLLFKLAHNPRSGFVELGLRSEDGDKLRSLVKNAKRHEWYKVGECWHLFSINETPKRSVAYVYAETQRKFIWRIEGRKHTEGTDRTLAKAKAKVETYFEMLSTES